MGGVSTWLVRWVPFNVECLVELSGLNLELFSIIIFLVVPLSVFTSGVWLPLFHLEDQVSCNAPPTTVQSRQHNTRHTYGVGTFRHRRDMTRDRNTM